MSFAPPLTWKTDGGGALSAEQAEAERFATEQAARSSTPKPSNCIPDVGDEILYIIEGSGNGGCPSYVDGGGISAEKISRAIGATA